MWLFFNKPTKWACLSWRKTSTPWWYWSSVLTWWFLFVWLLQVVQGLLEVSKVVIGHTGSVQSFKVLSFLVKHFQTVFLHSFIVHQLHLQKTGCHRRKLTEEAQRKKSYCMVTQCEPILEFHYTAEQNVSCQPANSLILWSTHYYITLHIGQRVNKYIIDMKGK